MNVELIRKAFKEKNISIAKLANECKLGYATCHDILSGKKTNANLNTIHKLASFLNLSIDELMED
ncbi:helix-turn-helix transcriptional regulator [uncultured Clostridium sp.]|uniref:helix-turn-helix domain-containing protein n=1 Tax=uncultured Clostridium sp. TaxID=59620 RepID=UPI002609C756|nr:helix-turn-helix transcriptional regulator [uncultured Clostridium sp.]